MPEPDATATRSDDARVADLLDQIAMHNYAQYSETSQRLIASLMAQVSEYRATLDAIREGVALLYASPYMPSEGAVMAALFPRADIVATYQKETQA